MEHDTLGYYLKIWRTVEKLKQAKIKTPIESENNDDGLLDLLWRLRNSLQEQSDHQGRGGLRPFPSLYGLSGELDLFCHELEAASGEEDPVTIPLGVERRRRLQVLMQKFEDLFKEHVETRLVFISPERSGLLEFLSPQKFLHDDIEWQLFRQLPQIAQQNFQDAGKCLVYALPGAAVPLALQAVEATIRYYYLRHGGPKEKDPEWAHMVDWLSGKNQRLFPGDEIAQRSYADRLQNLRLKYRNAVAHARAYFEAGQLQTSLSEGERVFRECWEAARILAAEVPKRQALRFQIKICRQLSFDDVLAAYLYSWNPEFPPFDPNDRKTIVFDEVLEIGQLEDSTITETSPPGPWPRKIAADQDKCLSKKMLDCFRTQEKYADTLQTLLDFVEGCRKGLISDQINTDTSGGNSFNLVQLFTVIKVAKNGDAPEVWSESHSMLDRFVRKALSPYGPHLKTELDMTSLYLEAQRKLNQ